MLLSIISCDSTEKKKSNIPVNGSTEGFTKSQASGKGIKIISPAEGTKVSSPIEINGKAKGTWFFEAVFEVRLIDEKNNILAESYVNANEEWMTEDWVSIEGNLEFSAPESASGFLIFEKANPSGLEKHSLRDTVRVRFQN